MYGVPGPQRRAQIDRSLARLDLASHRSPWTKQTLELVRQRPGVAAAELAGSQRRPVSRFKSDVWKLRELGLVEALAVGYRLSSHGQAYLDGRE